MLGAEEETGARVFLPGSSLLALGGRVTRVREEDSRLGPTLAPSLALPVGPGEPFARTSKQPLYSLPICEASAARPLRNASLPFAETQALAF